MTMYNHNRVQARHPPIIAVVVCSVIDNWPILDDRMPSFGFVTNASDDGTSKVTNNGTCGNGLSGRIIRVFNTNTIANAMPTATVEKSSILWEFLLPGLLYRQRPKSSTPHQRQLYACVQGLRRPERCKDFEKYQIYIYRRKYLETFNKLGACMKERLYYGFDKIGELKQGSIIMMKMQHKQLYPQTSLISVEAPVGAAQGPAACPQNPDPEQMVRMCPVADGGGWL
mgnify:CR=1 FL=1